MPGTELATTHGISSLDVLKHIETGGSHKITIPVEDGAAISARIDAEIVNAGSAAELFGSKVVLHAQDYVGVPFQLLNVEWRASDMGDGLPVYAVLSICDTQGEIHTMTTGARSIVLKCAKAASEGWLPVWVKVVEGKATEKGNIPLDLAAADPSAF